MDSFNFRVISIYAIYHGLLPCVATNGGISQIGGRICWGDRVFAPRTSGEINNQRKNGLVLPVFAPDNMGVSSAEGVPSRLPVLARAW